MNAVEATLSFDKSVLSVVSATKEGSAFSLWTTEPAFDNAKGTITFGGGNPSPFTNRSTLITVTFRALAEGTGKVTFPSASVLAADGKGTDILGATTEGSYEVTPKAAAPEPEEEEEDAQPGGGIVPDALDIKSETHPEAEGWYNLTEGTFDWELLPDVTAVRLVLSDKDDARPEVLYQPPIATKTLEDLEEGIWYLRAQARNASGWGPIGTRKIQVDLTPPEMFSLSVGANPTSTQPTILISSSTDALSGLDRYEVVMGTEQPIAVGLSDVVEGAYRLPPHNKGSYTVIVRLFDKAGNSVSAQTSVTIEDDIVSKPAEEEVQVSFWQRFGMMIIIAALLIAIGTLSITNVIQKGRLVREMRRGAKEAEEIRIKMEKIFSALKDEVEEQINALDKKPRLSEAEKRAISKIKEAIDISEELIGKEIDDVEKILE